MPWTNYHSHTYYCDGKNPPIDYIHEALKQGMAAYGYSSHAPVPFHCEWTIPKRKTEAYLSDIAEIKRAMNKKIEVYLGLEVDYIPGVMGPKHPSVLQLGLDYTIGSIHMVGTFDDGEQWCIDWTYDFFLKGLKEIFHGNMKNAVLRFFGLTREMLHESPPDLLGHLDKIRMHNRQNSLFDEGSAWYKNEMAETLKLVKKQNVILEINTRGHYKAGAGLYPHPNFFGEIRKRDIPVSLNSDAHQPHEITKGFLYGAQLLKENGIDKTWALVDGKWQPFTFDPSHGLFI
jgi:histidinol-phosphatase (PHP family)